MNLPSKDNYKNYVPSTMTGQPWQKHAFRHGWRDWYILGKEALENQLSHCLRIVDQKRSPSANLCGIGISANTMLRHFEDYTMATPAGAEYDYTKRKWIILVLTPTDNGTIEADGPPPEQLEQARKEAARQRKRYGGAPQWWEEV